MIEKLSTDAYQFDVTGHSTGGFTIVLKQVASGKTKVFKQASSSYDGLYAHMLSLTDDLCEQWFNERAPKKKKDKK